MIGDMYGDFSRLTFEPEKHFSAVLVQQGRVTLDADANEHAAILLRLLRRLTVDVIGPYAGPAGPDANFLVTMEDVEGEKIPAIAEGHYYVQGLLCEAEADTTYYDQPDAFLDPELTEDALPAPPYLLYLRVWERHITAVEDPSIRELALGDNGPDTAVRSKVVWQLLATADFPPGSGTALGDMNASDIHAAFAKWVEDEAIAPRPMLKARAKEPASDELDPCIISPEARYRGLENQLYRVEIHSGGTVVGEGAPRPTFKWSRDNGVPVFPIVELNGAEATVVSLGRDPGLGLVANDWVEVLDDRSVLRGDRQALIRVIAVDPLDRIVDLEHAAEGDVGQNPSLHPLLRRWDQQEGPANRGYPRLDPATGVLDVSEGSTDSDWLELENGVQVQFQPDGRDYRAGDYWLIPARTATEDVEWPQEVGGPAARPPVGIRYYHAPLALVGTDGSATDLRSTIKIAAAPVNP